MYTSNPIWTQFILDLAQFGEFLYCEVYQSMVNCVMSGERIIETEQNIKTQTSMAVKSKSPHKISGRVDINNLMSRVREEERKQKKENLVFFGLISSVIVITGIIASL